MSKTVPAIDTQGEHDPDQSEKLKRTNTPLPLIAQVETVKAYDPSQDLLAVRNMRVSIANYFGTNGVPADIKEVMMMASLLKDIDASALGQMRIKVDEKAADLGETHKLAAIAALDYLVALKNTGQAINVCTNVGREAPSLPDDIESREFVAGESTQGTVNQTFDQFQSKLGVEIKLAEEDAPD